MKKWLFYLLLPSLALAACQTDGVCTLQEFKEKCPDCLVHNVTYPNSNVSSAVNQTHQLIQIPSLPLWVWLGLGMGILMLVLVIILIIVFLKLRRER